MTGVQTCALPIWLKCQPPVSELLKRPAHASPEHLQRQVKLRLPRQRSRQQPPLQRVQICKSAVHSVCSVFGVPGSRFEVQGSTVRFAQAAISASSRFVTCRSSRIIRFSGGRRIILSSPHTTPRSPRGNSFTAASRFRLGFKFAVILHVSGKARRRSSKNPPPSVSHPSLVPVTVRLVYYPQVQVGKHRVVPVRDVIEP